MKSSHSSIQPIKIALFVAFALLGGVLAYAAFFAPSTDIRTRAACPPNTKLVMKEKCTYVLNKKGKKVPICHKAETCVQKTTNLHDLRPTPKPTKPTTLQQEDEE